MKALSLLQPWASLMAWGEKRIETRSWSTSYRGALAIHASKRFAREDIEMCLDNATYRAAIGRHAGKLADLPLGAIVAVGNLHDVRRFGGHRDGYPTFAGAGEQPIQEREWAFGDFEPGRYGWVLSNVHPLPQPIPIRGSLGLWEMPERIADPLEHWWLDGGPFPSFEDVAPVPVGGQGAR